MLTPFEDLDGPPPGPSSRVASRVVVLGLLALGVAAGGTFVLLRHPVSPPPAAIAGDPLLVRGREVYLSRCVSCHGEAGLGNGPIAKGLAGPPVGNLTDATWKHGDTPGQVVGVISQGVKGTAMPGWETTLGPDGLQAVAAYVYHLAGREVPADLRTP